MLGIIADGDPGRLNFELEARCERLARPAAYSAPQVESTKRGHPELVYIGEGASIFRMLIIRATAIVPERHYLQIERAIEQSKQV